MKLLTLHMFTDEVYNFNKYNSWHYKGNNHSIISAYNNDTSLNNINTLLELLPNDINKYLLDIDKELELTDFLKIKSAPTFIFIPIKSIPSKAVGVLTNNIFIRIINDVFNINKKDI